MVIYFHRIIFIYLLVMKDLIFDLFIFLIALPYLYRYGSNLSKAVVVAIFLCHLFIAYYRYLLGKEITWPLWCELLSVIFGLILILDSTYTKDYVICLSGIVIIWAHINKILCQRCPYYF